MQDIINADLLAQMAQDQIEVTEVVNILDGMYKQVPSDDPEDRDYLRLFAANRLGKANDHTPQTISLGTRMVKFYYNPSYHFERVFLPDPTDEQLAQMSYEERKAEGDKRDLLDEQHWLYREIEELEAQLAPKKAKLRGINEALAAMMPKSKAIHYTPVVQVV